MNKLYLGIDVGSVSANTVILNDRGEVLEEQYTRIKGQPLKTVQRILEEILSRIPPEQFHSISFTGTGGKLLSELLGGHFVNEIIAQARAVQHFYPEIRTIIDIGGEDSKLIFIEEDLDDHSRFILSGAFFFRQFKLNVFLLLYRAFVRWGIPKAILSDRGSQFKSHHGQGEADYQWYAKKLGVELIYANRAQTKGKIERLFRFIQRDFVMENLHLTSLEEINVAFERWIEDYNFNHSNKALDKECAAGVYSASPRRLTAEELEFILVHEEPRKVLKTGAITFYGQYYKVPDAYIGRRVWTKLKGDTLFIESAKKVIAEHQIKHDRFDEPSGQL